MSPEPCPFCELIASGEKLLLQSGLAVALPDAFPLTTGHSLVLSRRHVDDFFSLEDDERTAILALTMELQALLKERYDFAGLNIGLNNGVTAGQTIPHVHLHVIPRYLGDTPDPRGGIRWVFPDRAAYWSRSDSSESSHSRPLANPNRSND